MHYSLRHKDFYSRKSQPLSYNNNENNNIYGATDLYIIIHN